MPGDLVRIHTAHKLTLMAHSIKHRQELAAFPRLRGTRPAPAAGAARVSVAQAGTLPWDDLVATYGARFMEGLVLLGARRKHVNVLQHLMGYQKRELSSEDKQELLALIEDYRQELAPLTLLQHHLRRHPVSDWVWEQVYLRL